MTPEVVIPGAIARVFFNEDGSFRTHTDTGHRVRYRVLYGGRGGAKTESIARILPAVMRQEKGRALCTRQYQSSIADSVHRSIEDAITGMGLTREFDIQKRTIISLRTGSDAIFKGLQRSIGEIKSLKGVRWCWVEEAEPVEKYGWQILDPTIREPGSEIWITLNQDDEDGATRQMFIVNPPRNAIVQKVNWDDNPFVNWSMDPKWISPLWTDQARPPGYIDSPLAAQRLNALENDADAYDWIWEGNPRKISDAVIFRQRVKFHDFNPEPSDEGPIPLGAWPYYGMDFGFANDPSTILRCFITGAEDEQELWISTAKFGYRVEIDDLPEFLDDVPGIRDWPIVADSARPDTISYLSRHGFQIAGAEKGPRSIEDGIAHLKGFKRINIRLSDKEMCAEARLYSYKQDQKRLDEAGKPVILPIIIDAYNHGWDAIRYALEAFISDRGGMGVWSRLG